MSHYRFKISFLMKLSESNSNIWMLALVCVKQSDSFISPSIVCVKCSDYLISILLHNIVLLFKFWASQIFDYDQFDEQHCYCRSSHQKCSVIVLFCAKFSKLITSEKNIISVQQLPWCLSLFVVFFSEVLNIGIKSCFDGVVFQDAFCKECFSIRLRRLHL